MNMSTSYEYFIKFNTPGKNPLNSNQIYTCYNTEEIVLTYTAKEAIEIIREKWCVNEIIDIYKI